MRRSSRLTALGADDMPMRCGCQSHSEPHLQPVASVSRVWHPRPSSWNSIRAPEPRRSQYFSLDHRSTQLVPGVRLSPEPDVAGLCAPGWRQTHLWARPHLGQVANDPRGMAHSLAAHLAQFRLEAPQGFVIDALLERQPTKHAQWDSIAQSSLL